MYSWFWRLCAITSLLCLCSSFQIYHTAVINNLLFVATPWLKELYRTKSGVSLQWSLMTSAVPFGKLFGTLSSGYLADSLGGHSTIFLWNYAVSCSPIVVYIRFLFPIFKILYLYEFSYFLTQKNRTKPKCKKKN